MSAVSLYAIFLESSVFLVQLCLNKYFKHINKYHCNTTTTTRQPLQNQRVAHNFQERRQTQLQLCTFKRRQEL